LRQEQGKFWMYRTPWHGEAELACLPRALVKAVFFLRHGKLNKLSAKTGAEAASLRFLAAWHIQNSSGFVVHPAKCTRRVANSMTKSR